MSNLFSTFSPIAAFGLNLNWLSAAICLFVLPPAFWLINSPIANTFHLTLSALLSDLSATAGPFATPGLLFIPITLFLVVAINGGIGLLPYTFTASSHLSFTVSIAIPLWLGQIIFSFSILPQNFLAHLVPLGTPVPLIPLIVLIETTSNLIRPITLSVRLAANITAGHLLLALVTANPSLITAVLIILGLFLLCLLESAVALIQAYVFSALSALYVLESDAKELS